MIRTYQASRALLRAFSWAVNNQSARILLDAAYGKEKELAPAYLEEKRALMRADPLGWFLTLDSRNQTRFLAWLDMTYGAAAADHVVDPARAVACWTLCPCCEDHLCNLHGSHAHDCACLPVEEWSARGLDPYTSTLADADDAPDPPFRD